MFSFVSKKRWLIAIFIATLVCGFGYGLAMADGGAPVCPAGAEDNGVCDFGCQDASGLLLPTEWEDCCQYDTEDYCSPACIEVAQHDPNVVGCILPGGEADSADSCDWNALAAGDLASAEACCDYNYAGYCSEACTGENIPEQYRHVDCIEADSETTCDWNALAAGDLDAIDACCNYDTNGYCSPACVEVGAHVVGVDCPVNAQGNGCDPDDECCLAAGDGECNFECQTSDGKLLESEYADCCEYVNEYEPEDVECSPACLEVGQHVDGQNCYIPDVCGDGDWWGNTPGTPLNIGFGGGCNEVPLPFTLTLYGVEYTSVWINLDGTITLNGCEQVWAPGVPGLAVMLGNIASAFNPAIGGTVYISIEGIAPNRVFVVTWVSGDNNNMLKTKFFEGGDIQAGYLGNDVPQLSGLQVCASPSNDE